MIGDQLQQPEQPPADCHRNGAPKVIQESLGSNNAKEFFKPNNAGEPFEPKNSGETFELKNTGEPFELKNPGEPFELKNPGEPFELKNIQESSAEKITQVISPFEPSNTQESFVPFESYHRQEAIAETAQKDDKKEDEEEAINEFEIIYPYWDENCGLLDNDE